MRAPPPLGKGRGEGALLRGRLPGRRPERVLRRALDRVVRLRGEDADQLLRALATLRARRRVARLRHRARQLEVVAASGAPVLVNGHGKTSDFVSSASILSSGGVRCVLLNTPRVGAFCTAGMIGLAKAHGAP